MPKYFSFQSQHVGFWMGFFNSSFFKKTHILSYGFSARTVYQYINKSLIKSPFCVEDKSTLFYFKCVSWQSRMISKQQHFISMPNGGLSFSQKYFMQHNLSKEILRILRWKTTTQNVNLERLSNNTSKSILATARLWCLKYFKCTCFEGVFLFWSEENSRWLQHLMNNGFTWLWMLLQNKCSENYCLATFIDVHPHTLGAF